MIPATQDVSVFTIGRSNERARTSNNRVRRRIKLLSGLMRSKTRLLISNSSICYDGFINKWRVVSPDVIKGNVYDKIEDDYGSRQAIRISDKEFKKESLVTSVTGAQYLLGIQL